MPQLLNKICHSLRKTRHYVDGILSYIFDSEIFSARVRKKILIFIDKLDSKASNKSVFKIQAVSGPGQNRDFSKLAQIFSNNIDFFLEFEVDPIFCLRVLIRPSKGTCFEKMSQI